MLRTPPVFKFLQIGAVALLVLAFAIGAAGAQPAQAATFADPSSASARGYVFTDVFTYRGKNAAAAFYNFDGCIQTELLVEVVDEINHAPPY